VVLAALTQYSSDRVFKNFSIVRDHEVWVPNSLFMSQEALRDAKYGGELSKSFQKKR